MLTNGLNLVHPVGVQQLIPYTVQLVQEQHHLCEGLGVYLIRVLNQVLPLVEEKHADGYRVEGVALNYW